MLFIFNAFSMISCKNLRNLKKKRNSFTILNSIYKHFWAFIYFKTIYETYLKTFFFSLDKSKVFCEICITDNELVEATHFCKTCDDPDPLCGTCAKIHLRHKLIKNHEICADIEHFPYKEKKEWYLILISNTKKKPVNSK